MTYNVLSGTLSLYTATAAYCYKAYEICYTRFNISHHILPTLLHYLGKFKSSNLLQIRKNVNKMH